MGGRGAKSSIASSSRPKADNDGVRQLDKELIKRSNAQSLLYDAGDSINREYNKNVEEIKKLDLSDSEKKEAIKKQYELSTEALEAQSKYVSTYVSGPARKIKANDSSNLEKASSKRAEVSNHMKKLKEQSKKNAKERETKGLFEAMSKAVKNKQLTVTYNGKTYKRKTTRGRTFTLVD